MVRSVHEVARYKSGMMFSYRYSYNIHQPLIDIVTIYTSRSVSDVQNIATFIVVAKFDIIIMLLVSQPTIILSVLPYVMLRNHVDA